MSRDLPEPHAALARCCLQETLLLWLPLLVPAKPAAVWLLPHCALKNAQLLNISLLVSKALGPGGCCAAVHIVFRVPLVCFLFALLDFLALTAHACGIQLVSEPC